MDWNIINGNWPSVLVRDSSSEDEETHSSCSQNKKSSEEQMNFGGIESNRSTRISSAKRVYYFTKIVEHWVRGFKKGLLFHRSCWPLNQGLQKGATVSQKLLTAEPGATERGYCFTKVVDRWARGIPSDLSTLGFPWDSKSLCEVNETRQTPCSTSEG